MNLTFGIDFDDTIDRCPELWSSFIKDARNRGCKFYLVTARRDTLENEELINALLDQFDMQMPIIFSSLGSKLAAVAMRGVHIDVWIDDNPHSIVQGL